MKKNKLLLILIILITIFSCNKNEKNPKENTNNKQVETNVKRERLFSETSIDNLLEIFEKVSKKNNIEIENFEKLDYDNKNFYRTSIKLKENSTYTIEYTGINAVGLFVKIDTVNDNELEMIENFVINLIQISDKRIKEEEAKQLYSEILASMKEDELSAATIYNNGLTYGIQIGKKTGEMVFFIQ